MKLPCSKPELVLVGMAIVMGVLLRVQHLDRLAVEHFDEGVYAAGLWHDGDFGTSYPHRQLYAPPLLPTMIEVSSAITGHQPWAVFLPSLLLGCATIPLMWWLARMSFGMNAGLFIVYVVAFSDYHIQFSRMALTDVPVLFWMTLAVTVAAAGINRSSYQLMIVAGICCAAAWWTKYTGWLPLAIVSSGVAFRWLLRQRTIATFRTSAALVLVMAATAFVCWSPWLWMLQDAGGYAAVAANHSGYYTGLSQWQNNMAAHIMYYFHFDSWLAALAVIVGMMAAGSRRWMELAQSRPTDQIATDATSTDAAPSKSTTAPAWFPPPRLLAKFCSTALVMGVVATGVSSVGLLTCLGIGGLAGMFLWPTLTELHRRRVEQDTSLIMPGGAGFFPADMRAAPAIDPMIGFAFAASWLLGMVFATPMYSPFPRLSMPLLASIWLAGAGGVAWWMEANTNVARRSPIDDVPPPGPLKRIVNAMVVVALALTISVTGGIRTPTIWRDRTSLRDASWHLGEAALQDAAGKFQPEAIPWVTEEDGIIRPDPPEQFDEDGNLIPPPGFMAQLYERISKPYDTSTPLADIDKPTCVVYGFGEPSVLFHLRNAGLNVSPVQDVNFPPAALNGEELPTYLVLGPNALRTEELLYDWTVAQYRFEHVADFRFAPSDVVLFNLFSPMFVSQHDEAYVQKLELYRVGTHRQAVGVAGE
ncbi:ArnT family glycosyltransferase [Fuerstiella marisgermanici]|uniref:Putative membrane protein n=1 Tax=Fuerstiella marisgermanici TaxID=1891926 RepID=A0A1P8WEB4_9PLAN|nr:glycosyltransferase family 39 protein [Fuerstiella marisgermanici]APZ92379.1 putative membrane protein [Fuerstiella marisgermanici]